MQGVYSEHLCLLAADAVTISGHQVWDIDTGACLHVLRGHIHQIYSVAFDGERVASGGLDTTVRVWDSHTGCVITMYNR